MRRWLLQSNSPQNKAFVAADAEVAAVKTPDSTRKRKRGEYHNYTGEQRAKIAKFAVENGNIRAARHFSQLLGFSINESSVRTIKKCYLRNIKLLGKDHDEVLELPRNVRGRPTILGDKLETELIDYCQKVREEGGILNSTIVRAAAKGIISFRDKTLLQENGGYIELSSSWAKSFLHRHNYVKRKGTKCARHLPENFEELRTEFLERISTLVQEHDIPDAMIINWDQTGVPIVPVSQWTLDVEGVKQVS